MILPFLIAWLATKINCHQAHVIAYLREENRILKAKLKGRRIQLDYNSVNASFTVSDARAA